VLPVLRSELGNRLYLINEGRYGRVYRTSHTLRRSTTDLVYKEYIPLRDGGQNSGASAQRAVNFRDWLSESGQDDLLTDLNRYFAWPSEVVIEDESEQVCGFLMPLAGRDFFWPDGLHANQPRTLDWVTTTPDYWEANQIDLSDVTETDRLFLMVQLAYAVAWLHEQGWVYGDLSFKNAASAQADSLRLR
jgi:hypothetical protein